MARWPNIASFTSVTNSLTLFVFKYWCPFFQKCFHTLYLIFRSGYNAKESCLILQRAPQINFRSIVDRMFTSIHGLTLGVLLSLQIIMSTPKQPSQGIGVPIILPMMVSICFCSIEKFVVGHSRETICSISESGRSRLEEYVSPDVSNMEYPVNFTPVLRFMVNNMANSAIFSNSRSIITDPCREIVALQRDKNTSDDLRDP